ncbi:nuclear transport factor 2 family protein [Euzebya tangerina]|uniref:nuclear transport factor 2 family protein n=1 Tax=Euzebya tangerina TaxID=591198 RepID=UPI000E31D1AC|nr:nuclear transport factor 2 family protein [Euzebya tangerina]
MGRAREHWELLRAALEKTDVEAVDAMYAPDAVWLEPHNPPHETNKLIAAYLSSWMQARENIDVTTKRLLESGDGSFVAVEWAISYTAAGRRWNSLPRSSWIEVGDEGITYHRDYL